MYDRNRWKEWKQSAEELAWKEAFEVGTGNKLRNFADKSNSCRGVVSEDFLTAVIDRRKVEESALPLSIFVVL
jgi:predicted phage-related endonuclease